jgi:hypothetical protein
MSNMTQIIPTKPHTGLALDQRTLVRWLASEFNTCEVAGQAEKTSGPDEKKGG